MFWSVCELLAIYLSFGMNTLDLLFQDVLHSFSKLSFKTYLDFWLSIFPWNHADKILSGMVSTESVVLFRLRLDISPYTSPCIFPVTLQKYSNTSSTGHSNPHGTLRGRSCDGRAAIRAPLYWHSSLLSGTWAPFPLSTEESCISAHLWYTFSLVSKCIIC